MLTYQIKIWKNKFKNHSETITKINKKVKVEILHKKQMNKKDNYLYYAFYRKLKKFKCSTINHFPMANK